MTTITRCDENGRVCTKCKLYKAWSDFPYNRNGVNGNASICLVCKRKRSQVGSRTSQLKSMYGIDEFEFNRILKLQNGICKICGEPHTLTDKLCVDHCHTTFRIRGLLCRKCNTGLGAFKDDITLLNLAISYLKQELKDE